MRRKKDAIETGKSKSDVVKTRSARVIKRITVEAVAERRDILAQRVKKDRKERYENYISKIMPPRQRAARTSARATAFFESARIKILAEGDSWFEYPMDKGGVIDHLENLLNVPICNMAHHGDEVRQIMGVSQREELQTRLSDDELRFDALLFSGGGNDLVGDQFCLWLNDYKSGGSPGALINRSRLAAVLAIIEAGYRDLIAITKALSPETKIFLHGYDFPMATGKGVCFVGPWLKPSLELRGIEDEAAQFEVVKEILTQFASILKSLAASNPGRVFYVPTQNTLQPTPSWWANEIHPSSAGFMKIAEVFEAEIREQFPDLDS
ncbi:MAG: SGNH/GDSL hydrolase family protein [Nitrospirae bacterium]|nr:SGNH/GDSL hydrolase family protein [Nitrospirota bacterium]